MIHRALFQYLRKFGLEAGLFWLLVAASGWAMAHGAMPKTCRGLAQLEIIALAWLTVRLVLAEDGFKAHAGWRTRPVRASHLRMAQFAAMGLLLVGPLGLRAMLLHHWLNPSGSDWATVGKTIWLPQFVGWLGFGLALELFGRRWLRDAGRLDRVIGWCALALVVFGGIYWIGRTAQPDPDAKTVGHWHPFWLRPDIQRQLEPTAADFLGEWGRPPTAGVIQPKARLLLRIPLGQTSTFPGGRVLAADAALRGVRVAVGLRLVLADATLQQRLTERVNSFPLPFITIPVLRYGDGTVALPVTQFRLCEKVLTPLVGGAEIGFAGTFPSPLSFPEFQGKPADFLTGAELLFFGADTPDGRIDPKSMPQPVNDPKKKDEIAPLPANASPAELAAYTHRLVDAANRYAIAEGAFDTLPAAAVPAVLERFPWGNEPWSRFIHPYLLKHVTAADLPKMLERLEFEPRLGTVFVEKGWSNHAMPHLRQFARDRVPLESTCIRALVDEQDPALADDLKAVALLLEWWPLRDMEPVLRRQPGFDWPGFAKEKWRRERCQYGAQASNADDTPSPVACWAAREGDASAFRLLAELATCGRTPELAELKSLVAGEHPDLLAYLRENLDQLKFDPVVRKWSR